MRCAVLSGAQRSLGERDLGARTSPGRRRSDEAENLLGDRFLEALRIGDPMGAEAIAQEALDGGMDAPSVHSRLIAPAMHRIGELWQEDRVSIAVEHLATAISQDVLGRLYPKVLRTKLRSRERVILAAAQGEQHVLGLRMVADVLEGAGFDVLYLGADVPLASLLESCRTHEPAVLGLTVTMPLNVPNLIREIGAVCALEQAPAVMVAGQAAPLLIEQGLSVPMILRSEEVVSVVEELLAHPRLGVVVPAELAGRVPPQITNTAIGTEAVQTTEHGFSQAALASADTARSASRHAFAMEHLAYHDHLTGLWNRRAYDDRFDELTSTAGAETAVLMVDVDKFKRINDTFGHEVGDTALVTVAEIMLASVRPGDFAARLGGDEFSILLPGASLSLAAEIGERLRANVEETMRNPDVSVSVGVVLARDSQRATSLAVDQALYDAKENGRNRVTVADA